MSTAAGFNRVPWKFTTTTNNRIHPMKANPWWPWGEQKQQLHTFPSIKVEVLLMTEALPCFITKSILIGSWLAIIFYWPYNHCFLLINTGITLQHLGFLVDTWVGRAKYNHGLPLRTLEAAQYNHSLLLVDNASCPVQQSILLGTLIVSLFIRAFLWGPLMWESEKGE